MKEKNEKCRCSNFDKKMYGEDEILEEFTALAKSKLADTNSKYKTGFTILLQCPECNSYYTMDVHPNQQSFSISGYSPKVDEEAVKRTLDSLEGRITNEELDRFIERRQEIKKWIDRVNP